MVKEILKYSLLGWLLLSLTGCASSGESSPDNASQNPDQTDASEQPTRSLMCEPTIGSPHYYRKPLLIIGTTDKPDLARDLPGLTNVISTRLQEQLAKIDRFELLSAPQVNIETGAFDTEKTIQQVSDEFKAQFVIKLEVQDLTVLSEGNPVMNLFGAGGERSVQIKLYIFDGEHGAVFHTQQFERVAEGDVIGFPGNSRTVTAAWLQTDLGSQVDGMLKNIATAINLQLACVPFSTDVSAVNNEQIHFNAGYLNGIKPGVSLRVYHRTELWGPDGAQQKSTKGGWVKVKTVFPQTAIAEALKEDETIARSPDDASVRSSQVEAGDMLRAW